MGSYSSSHHSVIFAESATLGPPFTLGWRLCQRQTQGSTRVAGSNFRTTRCPEGTGKPFLPIPMV